MEKVHSARRFYVRQVTSVLLAVIGSSIQRLVGLELDFKGLLDLRAEKPHFPGSQVGCCVLSDGIRWAVLGGHGGPFTFRPKCQENGVLTAVLKAKRKGCIFYTKQEFPKWEKGILLDVFTCAKWCQGSWP